jgi:putative transposase
MSDYRRYYVPGGTYFFTCVKHGRAPILTTPLGRRCLRRALTRIQHDHPFEIVAIVLLPEHWHTVWSLPPGDDRYPLRWMRIKEEFTEAWLEHGGAELPQSPSRVYHRQRGVWQKEWGEI